MSPSERIGAFLSGKPIDRFPCVPLILNHAARVNGVKIGAHNRDGALMGKCHADAYRRYGQDLITIFSDTAVISEAMGTELFFPEDDVPRVQTPAIPNIGDWSRLVEATADDGRLPVYLEAIRTASAEVAGEVPVTCCFPAPFTTAAMLRGTDQFARDLFRNRECAHGLLQHSLDACCAFSDAVVDTGGIPVVVDPIATGSVLGERHFREFALPYLTELHKRIAARGMPVLLHICGQTQRILDAMLESGAALLSLDDIPMSVARDRAGSKVALMGNVRPAQTLLKGKPEDVVNEVRELCEIGRSCSAGFVLGSGCEAPIATPPENIDAMMNAVREFGCFD